MTRHGVGRCRPGVLLLALLFAGPAALAATREPIDCPNSLRTEARAINDRGDIVGICEDTDRVHGFLLRSWEFILIDGPEQGAATPAFGVNNRRNVVGRYELGGNEGGHGALHGYLLKRSDLTTIDPPGSELTSARGIDDAGRIVGFYVDGEDGGVHGFLFGERGYRDLDVPGADVTVAMGISVTRIVGGYIDSNGISHGFVLKGGGYESIDVPGADHTRAFGVNVQGDIVGGWGNSCEDCFTNAFLLTRRRFQELTFPGALETVANGINALGQVVGTYVAEDGSIHGFLHDRANDQCVP